VIAVDTNLLVYAHRRDSPWHAQALPRIVALAEGDAPWAIPWQCLVEFVGIVTHPRIYRPASTLEQAVGQIDAWLESPRLVLLNEQAGFWEALREILRVARVVGPQVHDAKIMAICRHHGVSELWSADRDFGRFPGVQVRNPLVV